MAEIVNIPIPADQPRDGNRYLCTPSWPYQHGYERAQWTHPDSVHDHDDYGSLASGGSYEYRRCPNCSLLFHVTLPD